MLTRSRLPFLITSISFALLLAGGCNVNSPTPIQTQTYPSTDETPAISPDGKKIAYYHIPATGSTGGQAEGLYTCDTNGNNVRQVLAGVFTNPLYPSWAPDGRTIVFNGLSGASKIDSTGSSFGVLAGLSTGYNVKYSPDGKSLLFDSNYTTTSLKVSSIWKAGANLSTFTKLSGTGANSSQATWSPDGGKIAFTGAFGGSAFEIYTMDTLGGNVSRLTSLGVDSQDPAWSPDGQTIAFSFYNTVSRSIRLVNISSGSVTTLINNALEPNWSADGKRIFFVALSGDQSKYVLYRANADGTGIRQLTH